MANYRFQPATPHHRRNDEAETLGVQVYDTLRDEIITGAMRPGTRLVRRTLSKRLGVSPIPVGEALLRLEIDGLVESRPLHGSRVREVTLEEMRDDGLLREAIECQAARLCAVHASDADLGRLMNEAERLDRLTARGDPRSKLGMKAHLTFHVSVARCSGCRRLAEELERVWFRRIMRLNWIKASHLNPVPERWHQQLVEAMATRNPDAAERKMREHTTRGNQDQDNAIALDFVHKDDSSDG
jgi:DNA-binding GntR family transcriptional regulator